MKLVLRVLAVVIILFCSSLSSYSQVPDYSIPRNISSYQHEGFLPLIGKWNVTYEQMEDSVKKTYGMGTAEIYFMLYGRFLVIHNITTIQENGYECYTYIGWDKEVKEYFLFRLDNFIMTRINLTGTYNEKKKKWTFEGHLLSNDKNHIIIDYQLERDNKIVSTIRLDEGKGLKQVYKEVFIKSE